MGGFKAESKVIAKFGEDLDGLVTDAKAANTYADDHLTITGGDAGIFQTIVGAVSDAKTRSPRTTSG